MVLAVSLAPASPRAHSAPARAPCTDSCGMSSGLRGMGRAGLLQTVGCDLCSPSPWGCQRPLLSCSWGSDTPSSPVLGVQTPHPLFSPRVSGSPLSCCLGGWPLWSSCSGPIPPGGEIGSLSAQRRGAGTAGDPVPSSVWGPLNLKVSPVQRQNQTSQDPPKVWLQMGAPGRDGPAPRRLRRGAGGL